MMAGTGSLKIAEQIKAIVAKMLGSRIQDPRLGFVTITEVRLSKDWRTAEVFYSVFGDAEAVQASQDALEAAKGQIRTAVAKGIPMRFTPLIEFVLDRLPETSGQFEALLASVKAADAEIAAKAEGAEFAGEADPYEHPRDDGDE
ncbi:MAG: 30S ribosome-binding factor RbfA [Propionibacteriaceae bacterium]|jgi:ribosome-binding factor A|nr:30S ribosome-binding factor RbfA [Propionibacteriaceae bacterium]